MDVMYIIFVNFAISIPWRSKVLWMLHLLTNSIYSHSSFHSDLKTDRQVRQADKVDRQTSQTGRQVKTDRQTDALKTKRQERRKGEIKKSDIYLHMYIL